VTWRDAQGGGSCWTRTQLGCVCEIVTHYPRVCAVIPQVCLAVETYGVCDDVVLCSVSVTLNTLSVDAVIGSVILVLLCS